MERMDRDSMSRSVLHDTNGRRPLGDPLDDTSISDLFKRMTSDASLLMRQEISLAKAEMKESANRVKKMAVLVGIAAALAIPGAIAVTAFLVIALGAAINSYWASALIVGIGLLSVAALLVKRGIATVSDGKVGVPRTARSLEENAQWGKEELRAFKRELTA
jgi:uncharacterized membrane protein YqjE